MFHASKYGKILTELIIELERLDPTNSIASKARALATPTVGGLTITDRILVEDYQNGLPLSEIAYKRRTSPQRIKKILEIAGVPLRNYRNPWKDTPYGKICNSDMDELIKVDYLSGCSFKTIVLKYKISPATIQRSLARTNTPTRPKGRPIKPQIFSRA